MANNKDEPSNQLLAIAPDRIAKEDENFSRLPARVEFSKAHQKALFLLIISTAVLLLTWAWCTELSELAQAPGQMIPSEEVQPIRSPFDSKVISIHVKPGSVVKQGELLLRLDAKTFHAELEKYKHEIEINQKELERHQHGLKIISDYLQNTHELPSDLSSVTAVAKSIGDLYAAEERLARARLDMKLVGPKNSSTLPELGALKSQHQSISRQKILKEEALQERKKQFALEEEKLESKVSVLEEQVELQKAGVTQRKYSLECTQKQLSAYQKVFASGASSKTECLDAKMRVEDRQKDLSQAEERQRELEGQLEAARHELAQLRSRNSIQTSQMEANIGDIAATSAQVNTHMRNAERNLSEAETAVHVSSRAARSTRANEETEIKNLTKQIEQLKAALSSEEHSFEKGELRAPVDGTVALLHIQGLGDVVQHGQNLLTIVPDHEKLVACLHVPNEQVAFLHKNDIVKLQFPAYPYQQYGSIPAVITLIDDFPSQEKEYATTYRVILEPQRHWIMCRNKKIELRKGLEVEAQLLLRKRRLLVSILAPLLKLQYSHFKA